MDTSYQYVLTLIMSFIAGYAGVMAMIADASPMAFSWKAVAAGILATGIVHGGASAVAAVKGDSTPVGAPPQVGPK